MVKIQKSIANNSYTNYYQSTHSKQYLITAKSETIPNYAYKRLPDNSVVKHELHE